MESVGKTLKRGGRKKKRTISAKTEPRAEEGTNQGGEKKRLKASERWSEPTPSNERHAFVVTATSDHAETPLDAYVDVAPLLRAVASAAGKTDAALAIFDPYYADGGVVRRLVSLGFEGGINRNRDFYGDLARNALPKHDVLLTNPPYSADHIERLVSHVAALEPPSASSQSAASSSKKKTKLRPFALLVPSYVMGRPFWARAVAALDPAPFYVCPHRRYAYLPPEWARAAGTTTTTAPFPTAWFCWLPAGVPRPAFDARVDVFETLESVSSQHRDITDPRKKRQNPSQRRKNKQKAATRATNYAASSVPEYL